MYAKYQPGEHLHLFRQWTGTGDCNLTRSVTPKTIPASAAIVISAATVLAIPANGVLTGKAIYDFVAAKWTLFQAH